MKKIIEILQSGRVGVLATDTIYGLVGSVLSQKAVERIYQLKKRGANKPFIILISDIKDLEIFGVELSQALREKLNKFWPGGVSIILPCPNLPEKLNYLRPLNSTLAFRLPKDIYILDVLKQTGPLVAPSANPEGEKPAQTIEDARGYFGNKVDFYQDAGEIVSSPSTLVEIKGESVIIIRKGKININ